MRDFGDDGGGMSGIPLRNPPQFLLKISFMEEKNSNGTPEMVYLPPISGPVFVSFRVTPQEVAPQPWGP